MPESRLDARTESPTAAARMRRTPRAATRAARTANSGPAPLLVEVRRGSIVESRHRGHVVQVAADGRVERGLGDPEIEVTLRSAVKPFALVALVETGAAEDLRLSDAELAIMAASHTGQDQHIRTLQAVFRRAGMSQALLACGSVGMPIDAVTAARLARDGEEPGAIRHMCSGFHAASLLLSRFAGWPLPDYDKPDHPSQVAVRSAVSRVFGVRPADLTTGIDDCGLPTYSFPLVEVARAFAFLADPLGTAVDATRAKVAPSLLRIRDAMLASPDMVGGTGEVLDTKLMRLRGGRLIAKGGAEGLRGVGVLPGGRGEGSGAAGLAVRIEDGDGFARANRVATVESLAQLGALDDRDLRALAAHHRPVTRSPRGAPIAEVVAAFQLAPFSELL